MPSITLRDGCRLRKDWGAGHPVVLLHGWPLSSDSLDALSLAIAEAGMRAGSYGLFASHAERLARDVIGFLERGG